MYLTFHEQLVPSLTAQFSKIFTILGVFWGTGKEKMMWGVPISVYILLLADKNTHRCIDFQIIYISNLL